MHWNSQVSVKSEKKNWITSIIKLIEAERINFNFLKQSESLSTGKIFFLGNVTGIIINK